MARRFVLLLLLSATAFPATAAPAAEPRQFENARVEVRVMPRAPEQIAAFYIGRKFPAAMVDDLRGRCFFTILIRNKSDDILWLDLDQWRILGPGGLVRRYDRAYWREHWRDMDAPLPARSTFRWTLLPEQLDFRPGETEGGNVILPRTSDPYTIEAPFETGAERAGEPIQIRFEDLLCAE